MERPEVKARNKAYHQTPEYKARGKERRQTPEYKAKRKAYEQRPEVKAYHKKYAKEHEVHLKKYRKEYWSSSEVRARLREKWAKLDPKKKEELNKKNREYGSSPKGLAVRKARYDRTIDARHAEAKRGYEKVKREVFSGLSGGEPECAHCKETEFLF